MNWKRRAKRGPAALFIRLFFSFLITAIVSAGLVFLLMKSFRPAGGLHSVVEKNLGFYLTALNNSVAPDFSTQKLTELSENLGVYAQQDINPQTELPGLNELKPEVEELFPRYTLGRHKGYFYAINEGSIPRVAWMIKARDLPKGFQMTFIGIIGFLFVIFAMTFMSVHFFMKPIRVMLHGIEQIAGGNIKYRLSDRYRNGFSNITDRFNHIADQLERFILSKDRLLRDVSHELRSPLTRMGVAIDLLDDSKLKESLKKDSQIMNRLIHDLLESYRVQKTKTITQKVNVPELLKNLQGYYQSTDVEITVIGVPGTQWPLDPTLMEVILKNLIENSIKYTTTKPVRIVFGYTIQDRNLFISAQDNGPGIPNDELPYIFDPFFRSSQSRQQTNPDGFGLGLSIVKTYAELQNGKISVKNSPDGGVIFTLEFSPQF
ncbi:MAG: HAMP domain-containing histidine kinase [Bdellovibrionaceae bacterium]|nr:HAMP domain-containing histidine kinase [Pseudobdellovibrionaceae bacterium]